MRWRFIVILVNPTCHSTDQGSLMFIWFLEIDRENDEPGQVRTDKTRGGNKFSLILVLILTKEIKRKT